MERAVLYTCDGCGTVTQIERMLRLTTGTPRFCPYCGEPQLREVKSSFQAIDAACFVGMPPHIVTHLWHEWAVKPGKHTSLISYVRAKIHALASKKG